MGRKEGGGDEVPSRLPQVSVRLRTVFLTLVIRLTTTTNTLRLLIIIFRIVVCVHLHTVWMFPSTPEVVYLTSYGMYNGRPGAFLMLNARTINRRLN